MCIMVNAVNTTTIDLVKRVSKTLRPTGAERAQTLQFADPCDDAQMAAAEDALDLALPESLQTFLRAFGGIALPAQLGVVNVFGTLGARDGSPVFDIVKQTTRGRKQHGLGHAYIVVGIGADPREWFCIDTHRENAAGEHPIVMFDSVDNAVDQRFYESFDEMLNEVMAFVAETLA